MITVEKVAYAVAQTSVLSEDLGDSPSLFSIPCTFGFRMVPQTPSRILHPMLILETRNIILQTVAANRASAETQIHRDDSLSQAVVSSCDLTALSCR